MGPNAKRKVRSTLSLSETVKLKKKIVILFAGDGLHSAVFGQQAGFRIRTFDRYANLRDVGGDTFIVRILKRGELLKLSVVAWND